MTPPSPPPAPAALLHEVAGAAAALGLMLEVAMLRAERGELEAVRAALRDGPGQLDRLICALSELRRVLPGPAPTS